MSCSEEIEYLKSMGVDTEPKPIINLKFSIKIDKYTFDYEYGKVVRVRADSFEEPRFAPDGNLSSSFKEEIMNVVRGDKKYMNSYFDVDKKIQIETQIDRTKSH